MRHALLFLLSYALVLSGGTPSYAQSTSGTLPPNLLNRNPLPPSPEAAALGRFGEVPVSLYTGVPMIDIPLVTLLGRSISIPVALQYHGGGVRPDQVAPWTGMNWTLQAGGAITRTCRGQPDFGGYFTPDTGMPPPSIPLGITSWCKSLSDNSDNTDYYEYIKDVLSGKKDSQPDLFSFNFMGYSGQIVFDQQGTAYTIPTQPLRILAPGASGGNYWLIQTPDGASYQFASTEYSSSTTQNPGPTTWYLTRITSLEREEVTFQYQPYQTELTYPNAHTTSAISTQTVLATNFYCEACPRGLDIGDRPTTHIEGQYLRRILTATHRLDCYSTGGRLDQPGTRQLTAVRLTCLTDSSRVLEYRLDYNYYGQSLNPKLTDRLMLRQVQKVGLLADGTEQKEPPYQFTYVTPASIPERGTYAVDRWGYYNNAINSNPFLRYNAQNWQVLSGADRQTKPRYLTFGLLQRLQYPTGGYSDFEFESNDFSNVTPRYTTADSSQTVFAQEDAAGNLTGIRTRTFTLTHAQIVTFHYTADPVDSSTDPVTQVDTQAMLYANSPGNPTTFTAVSALDYPGTLFSGQLTRSLQPGTYRLEVSLTRTAARAAVEIAYQQRWPAATCKELGGGTRIRRIIAYDGYSHENDQIKEYYYDNDRHTRSTGKLIHQPIFHGNMSYIIVNKGISDPDNNSCFTSHDAEWKCDYLIHYADDIAAASGSAQGNAVGYDTVTVVQRGPTTSLRTTSVFHNVAGGPYELDNQEIEYPGYIPLNFDRQNGLLMQTLDYRVAPNGDAFNPADYQLVRRVERQYGSPVVPDKDIIGLSIGGAFGDLVIGRPEPCRTIVVQSYRTRVGWWPLTSTIETRYDKAGKSFATTTRQVYESATHLQPTYQEVTESDGSVHTTRFKYPLDYVPGADAGIALLQQQHVVQTPVEVQQWVHPPGQAARWTGGTVTRFEATSGNVLVPTQQYQAALAAPQAILSEPRSPDQRYTTLLPSPTYELRAQLRYTASGTVAQQAPTHGVTSAFLWDYPGLRLLAQVQNATSTQVAYTSFEPAATGRWRYDSTGTHRQPGGRTGRWAYRLDESGSLLRPGLPAGEYELLYWQQSTNQVSLRLGTTVVTAPRQALATAPGGWQQYRTRFRVAAPATLGIGVALGSSLVLDEVRLHPVGAQMRSFTYEPLVGESSLTTPDGRTLTYEYDALGRLVRTRDEQGRILSQQQYHFVGTK